MGFHGRYISKLSVCSLVLLILMFVLLSCSDMEKHNQAYGRLEKKGMYTGDEKLGDTMKESPDNDLISVKIETATFALG